MTVADSGLVLMSVHAVWCARLRYVVVPLLSLDLAGESFLLMPILH